MKCVVSDYVNGVVRILQMDKSQCHEVEDILTQDYEFLLDDIEWILVENDGIVFG
jgi:hypothetical protein